MRRFFSLGTFPATLVWVAGCGVPRAPVIEPISDQSAAVGMELTIHLRAHDPGGDALAFTYDAPDLPDLTQRALPATLQTFADGVALFRWTPQPSDAGTAHAIDFRASNGHSAATETVQVTVKGADGAGAPIFREPLGTGTTLDLDKDRCKEVAILVQDDGPQGVVIAQEPPLIEGATLTQPGPFSALWRWCPTATQIEAQDRYYLRLSADDGKHPKAVRAPAYLIVLRRTTPAPGMGAP
jgi:hypothetical protein